MSAAWLSVRCIPVSVGWRTLVSSLDVKDVPADSGPRYVDEEDGSAELEVKEKFSWFVAAW